MVEPPKFSAISAPGRLADAAVLVSGLVHEIRNPLNAIRTNLEILGEDLARAEPEGPGTRRVARLLSETDRLNRILSDFLEYARGSEIHPREADLGRIVVEVAGLFRPEAEKAGVVLLHETPDAPCLRNVDPHAMKQVLLNLATNALQAMPDGGTLMLRVKGGVIEVADTGRGIPKEDLPRLFDLFYSNRPGGTGIGLAVVRRLVEAHGGVIEVQSETGKGTMFRICLP